jgi:hypothetical protein
VFIAAAYFLRHLGTTVVVGILLTAALSLISYVYLPASKKEDKPISLPSLRAR